MQFGMRCLSMGLRRHEPQLCTPAAPQEFSVEIRLDPADPLIQLA